MPDVPLPEPVASRDNFKRDEAHSRFFRYAEQLAISRELDTVKGYINDILDTETTEDAVEVIREKGSEYELYTKLANKHGPRNVLERRKKLMRWLSDREEFNFTLDDAAAIQPGDEYESRNAENTSDSVKTDYRSHPKWSHIHLLTRLSQDVSYATKGTVGDPNKKENRKTGLIGQILAVDGYWPILVGATLNEDRCDVIWHSDNSPNAVAIKSNSYAEWQGPPFNADLVKNVPFTFDEDDLESKWKVPEFVHERRTRQKKTRKAASTATTSDGEPIDLSDPDNFQERPVDVRCTENAAIDMTVTVGELMEALNDTEFGEFINHPDGDWVIDQHHIVLFADHRDELISENYDMSEYAALVKVNKSEAKALEDYEHVFYPDEYPEFIKSQTHRTYDPFTGKWERFTTEKLHDGRTKEVVWLDYQNAPVITNAVLGKGIPDVSMYSNEVIPTDDDAYGLVREAVFDYILNSKFRNPASDDQDGETWRIAFYNESTHQKHNLIRYAEMFYDNHTDRIKVESENGHGSSSRINMSRHSMGRTVERARYPAWDTDSSSWRRMGGYRQESYEEELMKAARDIGIDPAEHPEDTLRQAIVMLVDRCSDNQ